MKMTGAVKERPRLRGSSGKFGRVPEGDDERKTKPVAGSMFSPR